MVTEKKGVAGVPEVEAWARRITSSTDGAVEVSVYDDEESSTYILRIAKKERVLLFRLSEAQVRDPKREQECEKILVKKIAELSARDF